MSAWRVSWYLGGGVEVEHRVGFGSPLGVVVLEPVDELQRLDDVAKSLEFDDKGFRQVVTNIAGLKN